jgi:hypothetical protein
LLQARKCIPYRNSFQTFLVVRMRPDGTGTAIKGRLGMHVIVRALLVLWLTPLVGGVSALAYGAMIAPTHDGLAVSGGEVAACVILALGIVLVGVGRYVARHEAPFLKNFLMETLNASPRSS